MSNIFAEKSFFARDFAKRLRKIDGDRQHVFVQIGVYLPSQPCGERLCYRQPESRRRPCVFHRKKPVEHSRYVHAVQPFAVIAYFDNSLLVERNEKAVFAVFERIGNYVVEDPLQHTAVRDRPYGGVGQIDLRLDAFEPERGV